MLRLTRKLFSRSVVANRCGISSSASTRLERGTSTSRIGFSWSDSSRRSSIIGSFFARICEAICSRIFDGLTWCGSAVITMLSSSRRYTARARTEPMPLSYIASRSARGVMISASVG